MEIERRRLLGDFREDFLISAMAVGDYQAQVWDLCRAEVGFETALLPPPQHKQVPDGP